MSGWVFLRKSINESIGRFEIAAGVILFVYATLSPMIGRFFPILEPDSLFGLWPLLLLMLGPIFAAQGWTDSPFNLYPAKGAFMWRDMERRTAKLGLPFQRPPNFPQHTLLAARVALQALDTDKGTDFCTSLFKAQFQQGQNLADPDVIARALTACDLPRSLISTANTPEVKTTLKHSVDQAIAHGLFGAPSFTIGAELFWGDDQLEDALSFAKRA